MSVAEQRYLAVLAVIADGHDVSAAAQQWGVTRQTLHSWIGRYEAGGLAGLEDRSHRPRSYPHQMPEAWRSRWSSCGWRIRRGVRGGSGSS